MADLDIGRVKRNVAKMVAMGAPESDIDEYISQEGTTIDAVKSYKPQLEQSTSQFWHDFGNSKEPGYTYLDIFPVKVKDGKRQPSPFASNRGVENPSMPIMEPAFPGGFYSLAKGIGDLYQGAENNSIEQTPESIGAMLAVLGAKPSIPSATEIATAKPFISDNFRAERLAAKVAKNEANANKPVELYKDMLTNYKQVESVNNANFDNLSAISSKTDMLDVTPLQAGVKSIIKEIEDSPASPDRANLTFFKRVEQTIDKGEKLPVSDVVDLNKFLNSRYNPKKVGTVEKLSEAELHSQVKRILDGYGAKNPLWGDTYKQAQGFFQNEVAPLKSDFVTKMGFDVNDANTIERFNRGDLKQLPDELIQRARALPSKINDDVAYNRLAPLVSPEKQAEFGNLVKKSAIPAGSKSGNPVSRIGRTLAYGSGAVASGGSPYMRARFGAELAGMIKGQDPLYPLIKRGVQPIGERIAPDVEKASLLGEMIAKQPPAGQLALPYYPKGYSPAETPEKYAEALAAKHAESLAPSNIGQERAAFELSKAKAADEAAAFQQMEAQSALEARQAGISPEQYAKLLQEDVAPVVVEPEVTIPSRTYLNPYEQAQKASNMRRGAGLTVNDDFRNALAEALFNTKGKK